MLTRRLTPSGIAQFKDYITQARAGSNEDPPWTILEDPNKSEPIPNAPELDKDVQFTTRASCTNYLIEKLANLPSSVTNASNGLWTWLALFLFNQL